MNNGQSKPSHLTKFEYTFVILHNADTCENDDDICIGVWQKCSPGWSTWFWKNSSCDWIPKLHRFVWCLLSRLFATFGLTSDSMHRIARHTFVLKLLKFVVYMLLLCFSLIRRILVKNFFSNLAPFSYQLCTSFSNLRYCVLEVQMIKCALVLFHDRPANDRRTEAYRIQIYVSSTAAEFRWFECRPSARWAFKLNGSWNIVVWLDGGLYLEQSLIIGWVNTWKTFRTSDSLAMWCIRNLF